MLGKLQGTVKEDGYVIIDKAYVPELVRNNEMKYQNHEYLTRNEQLNLFEQNQLQLVEELERTPEVDFELEKKQLVTRANGADTMTQRNILLQLYGFYIKRTFKGSVLMREYLDSKSQKKGSAS